MEPESQQNNGSTDALRTDNGVDAVAETSSQTSDPIVSNSTPSQLPANGKKKFGKKTGLLIGIGVAVIALAGSASAYQFWYQNPDKVMIDALTHMMTEERARVTGTVAIDSKEVSISVALKASSDKQEGSTSADVTITPKTEETKFLGDIKLGAEAVVATNGDFYFKVKDVKPVVDKLLDTVIQNQTDVYSEYGISQSDIDSQRAEISRTFDPIIAKIDNRWIKVTADDLKQDGDDSQACVVELVEKINNDDSMRKELVDVYRENKFVVVDKELGVKDGSIGYQLRLDEDAAKSFGEAVEGTAFGGELKKCDSDIFENIEGESATVTDEDIEVSTEIWITRWSHKLSAIKASVSSADDDMSAVVDFSFDMGESDEVVIPSDATSIEELQADIADLMSGAAGAASLSI